MSNGRSPCVRLRVRACVCARACVRAYARAWMRAYARDRMRAWMPKCMRVRMRVCATWSSGSSLLFGLWPMSMNDCCASAKSVESGSVLDVDAAMDRAPMSAASSVPASVAASPISRSGSDF
jgi:hypothetical protein